MSREPENTSKGRLGEMTDESPRVIESFEEMTSSAIEMAKDLHQYIGKRSKLDLCLAIRSTAYPIGWLVSDLPAHLRELTFEAVIRDAKMTEQTIRTAGMDGKARMMGASAVKEEKTNLW